MIDKRNVFAFGLENVRWEQHQYCELFLALAQTRAPHESCSETLPGRSPKAAAFGCN